MLVFCAVGLGFGCQGAPRNGQPLPNVTNTVAFSGYSSHPSDSLNFQIQNQSTQAWVNTGYAARSTTTAFVDAAGVSWYEFGNDTVRLPSGVGGGAAYWRKASSVNGQRRIRADVRTSSSKTNGP